MAVLNPFGALNDSQSFSHSLTHWQAFRRPVWHRVPRHYGDWLYDKGSLTERLIRATAGDFQVRLLRQCMGKPTPSEQTALNINAPWAMIREVELICGGQPWVYARSIIPRKTLRGSGRFLYQLGSRPLGANLFSNPATSRGLIEIGRIKTNTLPLPLFTTPSTIWGRRSVFHLKNDPLLVSELFLPDCPMYNNNY